MGQMVKGVYYSSGFDVLETPKRTKKNEVFSKMWGGGHVTIFRLLGILPKITERTNGEKWILFRGVWCTWNKTKQQKKWIFLKDVGAVGLPFSDFYLSFRKQPMRQMVKCAYFSKGFDVLETKTKKEKKWSFFKDVGWWSCDHFQTFRWWKVHTFQMGLKYLKQKQQKNKKKWSFYYGVGWWSGDHFQTFRYPSENN